MMTLEEAIKELKEGRNNLYEVLDKSVPYEQQHTLVALDIAIKSLESWEKLSSQIQSVKTMKENELQTAGDLTTAYILNGEIDMLECISALITECLAEVQDGKDND